MSKKYKKNQVNKPVEEPKVEAPEHAEPTYAVKLEVMGAEEINLNGIKVPLMNNIRNWFAGLGSETTEINVGDNLLILDRSKIAYMVVGIQQPNEEGTAE